MRPQILLLDTIAEEGVDVLRRFADVADGRRHDEQRVLSDIERFDGLVIKSGNHIRRRLFERAARLRVIGRAGSGLDNIDLDAARERNVTIITSPEGNAASVAEYVLCTTLFLAHRLLEASRGARENDFRRATWQGRNLAALTLGVVGVGHIGRAVVAKMAPLCRKIVAHDPFVARQDIEKIGAEYTQKLDALLEVADVITLSLPLTPESRHLLNRGAFARMRRGAILVNTARGELIDDEALLAALDDGTLAAAALDVLSPDPPFQEAPTLCRYSHPLVHHPSVFYTPHIAAGTHDALRDVAVNLAHKMAAFFHAISE